MLLINFLIRALADPRVLEGLHWYRWGRVGSFLCSSTGFTLNTGSKYSGTYFPAPEIFSTLPQVVLQSSARRTSRWTV